VKRNLAFAGSVIAGSRAYSGAIVPGQLPPNGDELMSNVHRTNPGPHVATGRTQVRLYGAPVLAFGGHRVPFTPERRFQLLALLAVSAGEWVTRDRIAGLLWPLRSNVEARGNLRTVISRLRDVPGLQDLEVGEIGLRWAVDTDLAALFSSRASDASADGSFGFADDPAWAAGSGPLLQGMEDPSNTVWSDWLQERRHQATQRWRHLALDRLAQLSDAARRAELAAHLLRSDPLDEEALAALIAAEHALGAPARAQRAYRDYAVRLAQDLNVEPSAALRNLVEGGAAPPIPSSSPSAMLPSAAGSFVGRHAELAALRHRLLDPEGRFVTLVGPGGIGKSRLAMAAASRFSDAFPDGRFIIKLEDLESREQAAARLAQVLDLEVAQAADAMEPVLRWLAPRRALLVFDNAEHLAQAHQMFDRLRDACPHLALCVTSRQATGRPGEQLLALGGLPWPDDESRDAESATAYDAVQLFSQRAHAAQRSFELAPHLDAVVSIVQAVGGMPLAIELAAGWVRMLPPEEIARDLQRSMDLLERDPAAAGAPARPEHVSLRAVVERSWAMLAPRERDSLAAISVFRDGFTRAAAQAVAKTSMPLLSSLVDGGLLAVDADGRFALHQVIAAFADEHVAQDPERRVELELAHARWYAAELDRLAPYALTDVRVFAHGVAAELANATAAWHTAVREKRCELVDQLVRPLWRYFELHGRQHEGVALLTPALALGERGPAGRRAMARLRLGLSLLMVRHGRSQEALAIAEDGFAASADCGDLEAHLGCLVHAGTALWHLGRHAEARQRYESALTMARQAGDPHCVALAQGNLGPSLLSMGEYARAAQACNEALALDRALGHQVNVAANLHNLGLIHRELGDWAAARDFLEQGLRQSVHLGQRVAAAYLRAALGALEVQHGRVETGWQQLQDAVQSCEVLGLHHLRLVVERRLASVEIDAGRLAPALARIQALLRNVRDTDQPLHLCLTAMTYGHWLAACGRLDEAQRAWAVVEADPRADRRARTELSVLRTNWRAAVTIGSAAGEPPQQVDEILAALEHERA